VQRIELLLALQVVDLLLLARRVRFSLDAVDLLVGLQSFQLLIVPQLIQLLLGLIGLGFLLLCRRVFLLFDLVEPALRLICFLVPLEIFKLFLALQRFCFFLLASLGLFAQDFFELIRGCPGVRGREDERNDEIETQQFAERYGMLREPQHERNVNHFESPRSS